MNSVRMASAAILLCTVVGGASAQTSSPPTAVPGTNLDGKSGTLSKKLSDTNGVIKPEGNVDPSMHVPAPSTGTMPVIKPGVTGDGVAK